MDEQNNFQNNNSDENSQNQNSESFGNDRFQRENHSEQLPNSSDEFGKPSESLRNDSEPVPNHSESNANGSERNKESFGKKIQLSEKTPDHTLSVREVARLFEEAGAPRTERSIINWCNPNRRGLKRLDCYFDEADRKYFVTPKSVNQVIQEERKKQEFTDFRIQNVSEQQPNQFGNGAETIPNGSERVPKDSEAVPKTSENIRQDSEPLRKEPETVRNEEEKSDRDNMHGKEENRRLKDLEQELNDLRITNKAKDFFIERIQEQSEKERITYVDERKFLIEQLTTSSKKIGELETKLLQIEAPRREPIDAHGSDEKPPDNSEEKHPQLENKNPENQNTQWNI
jgi:hypothetical protein